MTFMVEGSRQQQWSNNWKYVHLLVSYNPSRCIVITPPKRSLAHVNFSITSADSISRGMKMRMIPRLITPSILMMCIFPALVRWITARWLGCIGCIRQNTASICARNLSGTPQTDANAAVIDPFRQRSSHPDNATSSSVSSMDQSLE